MRYYETLPLILLFILLAGEVIAFIGWAVQSIKTIRQKQLIEAYRDYIHLLESYIDRKESYLRVHRMGATQEEFEEGERLRNIIFKLKEEIK